MKDEIFYEYILYFSIPLFYLCLQPDGLNISFSIGLNTMYYGY